MIICTARHKDLSPIKSLQITEPFWDLNLFVKSLIKLCVFFFDFLSVASALPCFKPMIIKAAVTAPQTSPIRIPLPNPAATLKAVSWSRPNCCNKDPIRPGSN